MVTLQFSHLQHPNYDEGPGFTPNDISVVTASSSISGTNISPGSIPTTENPGGIGWITGWGRLCGQFLLLYLSLPPSPTLGMAQGDIFYEGDGLQIQGWNAAMVLLSIDAARDFASPHPPPFQISRVL